MLKKILLFFFLIGSVTAYAQVAAASRGGNSSVWVGGEFSNFNPDYDTRSRLNGVGVFGDFNLTAKLGVEGEARWLHWNGDGGEKHSDYLGGVKYRIFRFNRFSVNAKFLVGGVWVTYPDQIGTGSYFAYAPGGFLDYRVSRRLSVRGDYEYQRLPSAPGFAGETSHGLTPNGFSVGVAYRLIGAR